jgi:hypothetical protein
VLHSFREKIVFERVSDLLACLKELEEDPEVTIMRIKSSMTPSGQNLRIEGLRQISLNIKIQNEQTKRLCVHHHVCEVRTLPNVPTVSCASWRTRFVSPCYT